MLEFIQILAFVAVLGAICGGVAAFTHRVLISEVVDNVKAEVAKLEALKEKL